MSASVLLLFIYLDGVKTMPTGGHEKRGPKDQGPHEIVAGLVHEFLEMLGDGEAGRQLNQITTS